MASLVADAVFNGPKDFHVCRMVVDTGANMTMIPPQTALAIGCDPAKAKRRVAIVTASGLEYLPVVIIPVVEALGCRVRNLKVICHDLPQQSRVDGLLGLDFLNRFVPFQEFRRAILKAG